MLVLAVETYLGRNKEKLKDKLTSSHSKFGIKLKQKRDFEAFYFSSNIARCGWYVAGN